MIHLRSLLAGFLISMGGIIYTKVGGVAGAVLFSLGLLAVLSLRLELFTGKIGFLGYTPSAFFKMLMMNMAGCFLASMLTTIDCTGIMITRCVQSFPQLVCNGILCGACMYIAVFAYNNDERGIFVVPFAVAGFILMGGDHCIANTFYTLRSDIPWIESIRIISASVLGNTLGAIFIHKINPRMAGRR